jgi:hypothetical protein
VNELPTAAVHPSSMTDATVDAIRERMIRFRELAKVFFR